MELREPLAGAFGLAALVAVPLCFFGAAPVWAWLAFVLLPALVWLLAARGGLLGALLGLLCAITG